MKGKIFLFIISLLFGLVFVNFLSAIPYGSGVYGQGTSCIGYVVATPAAGVFAGGGGVIEKYIYKGWEVVFEFNNITYTISLEDVINNKTAVIKISGGNKNWNFNLEANQTKKIDLNEDYIYDLRIYLSNISGTKVYLTANSIQEEIFPKIVEEEIEKKFPILELLIFTIIVLVLIIIILIKIISVRKTPVKEIEHKYIIKKKKTEQEIKRGKVRAKRHLKPARVQKEKIEVIKPLSKKMKQRKATIEKEHRKRMIQSVRKRKISKK